MHIIIHLNISSNVITA